MLPSLTGAMGVGYGINCIYINEGLYICDLLTRDIIEIRISLNRSVKSMSLSSEQRELKIM